MALAAKDAHTQVPQNTFHVCRVVQFAPPFSFTADLYVHQNAICEFFICHLAQLVCAVVISSVQLNHKQSSALYPDSPPFL